MPSVSSIMKQFWPSFKRIDRVLDVDEHTVDAVNQVDRNRTQTLAESYKNGEIGFHLHIIGSVGNLKRGEYCISTEHRMANECRLRNDVRGVGDNVDSETHRSCRNDRDQHVLIGVVKDSDNVQNRVSWSSGVERLHPLDKCPSFTFKSPDSSGAFALPFPSRFEDWKLRVRIRSVAPSQLPGSVIEGRSKVVNAVTDHKAPSFCGDYRDGIEPNNTQVVCWLVNNESITFRLNKDVNFSLECIEMVLCPTKFGVTAHEPHFAEAVKIVDGKIQQRRNA